MSKISMMLSKEMTIHRGTSKGCTDLVSQWEWDPASRSTEATTPGGPNINLKICSSDAMADPGTGRHRGTFEADFADAL